MPSVKSNRTQKWYGGITLFKVTIQTKRRKLLSDPDVIDLLRAYRISVLEGESLETFIKSMKK